MIQFKKTNQKLRNYLSSNNSEFDITLDKGLEDLLGEGFTKRPPCLLLKSLDDGSSYDKQAHVDETGFECSMNHVHIDDYLGDVQYSKVLEQAMLFVKALQKKLHEEVNEKATIILSFDQADAEFPSAVVRFHIEREGQHWLDSDLDLYENEAIGIL